MLSMLEAGEGSSIARNQLDQWLHNYLEQIVNDRNRRASLGYEWAKLRQCLSIKEKISYIAGLIYADEGNQAVVGRTPLASTRNMDDARIRDRLNIIIMGIEDRLMNDRDFTESRILRSAALNRFQCNLSAAETSELNGIALKVKDVCIANGLDNLAEASNFTNESDAQKIIKM